MYVNIHNSSLCSVIDGDIKKVSFCCGVVVLCVKRERERGRMNEENRYLWMVEYLIY